MTQKLSFDFKLFLEYPVTLSFLLDAFPKTLYDLRVDNVLLLRTRGHFVQLLPRILF